MVKPLEEVFADINIVKSPKRWIPTQTILKLLEKIALNTKMAKPFEEITFEFG